MRALIRAVHESSHTGLLLERALEGAISLTEADFGNVQLRDLTHRSLKIASHSGFEDEFLEYFALVDDDTSGCGRAASERAQTVIFDVNLDRAFTPHREIAAASRFRAVQSTPVLDATGRLRGVISTHFRRPHRPRSRDLQLMQWYAEELGAALAQQHTPTGLYDASARLHAQSAELQNSTARLMRDDAQALLANGNNGKARARHEWARHAEDRARRERERTYALAERARAQAERKPPTSKGRHEVSSENGPQGRLLRRGQADASRPTLGASARDPRSS
jgi:GAF domain-containing protein